MITTALLSGMIACLILFRAFSDIMVDDKSTKPEKGGAYLCAPLFLLAFVSQIVALIRLY